MLVALFCYIHKEGHVYENCFRSSHHFVGSDRLLIERSIGAELKLLSAGATRLKTSLTRRYRSTKMQPQKSGNTRKALMTLMPSSQRYTFQLLLTLVFLLAAMLALNIFILNHCQTSISITFACASRKDVLQLKSRNKRVYIFCFAGRCVDEFHAEANSDLAPAQRESPVAPGVCGRRQRFDVRCCNLLWFFTFTAAKVGDQEMVERLHEREHACW